MPKLELPAAVYLEGFPVDPDFPQLRIASDPTQMLEVFRRHLRPAAGQAYHIQECVPVRFRVRQSRDRCVLQYRLRALEPATGRTVDPWVSGLLYARPGEAERLWQEMRAADPRRNLPEEWRTFEPVEYIPELQMVVQVFPYDRKLPNLSLVLNSAIREFESQMLVRLQRDRWQVTERSIEPTRYRTELGAALKYTMRVRNGRTSRQETLNCYLKVYRHRRGSQTFQLLRRLSERAVLGRGRYEVVKPVGYHAELRTLVLQEAGGASLQQTLLQNGDPTGPARAVARAVAAFNQDYIELTEHHTLAHQFDDLRRASTLVQWAHPPARADVQAITEAVLQGLEDVPSAPIHRDLKTDHIFLSGDTVVFIDLDSVVLGDPARDPAHLVAHLAARVGLDAMPVERARAAAAAFVDEYFAHVPDAWSRQFPLHCAGALVEVAAGIFKRQEPHWPNKVSTAIAEASRLVSGGLL